MPIFYTDNPVNVSGSVQAIQGSIVTASIPGIVTVTSSVASPVWITGTIQSVATQATAYQTGTTFPSSGNLGLYVSGAANTTVFGRVGTGTMGSAILMTLASDQPAISVSQSNVPAGTVTVSGNYNVGVNGTVQVSQSNIPAGTVQVSQSNIPAGTVTVSGNYNVGVNGSVQVSQSNVPAGTVTVSGNYNVGVNGPVTVTSTQANPVWMTATLPWQVSQSNIPAGTVTVSGNYNVGVNGTVTVSGNYNVGVNGQVQTSQSNVPAGAFQIASGLGSIGVTGTITAGQDKAGNATLTTVEVGNASTTLLAVNANRKGATIFSVDSVVFVAFGQTPTTTLYGAKVPSSSYYEIPYNWTGAVNAIAAVSGQTVNIQEFTA